MRVTFNELINRKEWLYKELMHSLTGELINKAKEDQFYDVTLLVNGVELEPQFYNDIVENINKYVVREAETIIANKFSDMMDSITNKVDELNESMSEAQDEIIHRLNFEK